MQWFHNRGTLSKLLGSFLVVCAIMGLVGWIGVYTAQTLNDNLEDVGKGSVPSILALAKTRAAVLRVQRDTTQAVLTSDQKETDTFLVPLPRNG